MSVKTQSVVTKRSNYNYKKAEHLLAVVKIPVEEKKF